MGWDYFVTGGFSRFIFFDIRLISHLFSRKSEAWLMREFIRRNFGDLFALSPMFLHKKLRLSGPVLPQELDR